MHHIAFKCKIVSLYLLLQFLAVAPAQAQQILASCPTSVKVNLDTKEKIPAGKTANYVFFSHPPGWDVHYEPGKTYQDMAFKTPQGKSMPGLLAGVKDLSSVPFHKLTVLGLTNEKKEFFSRVVCQYRVDPNGGFRITLAKSMPTTHSCFAQGSARITCAEKIKIYCPAHLVNTVIPKGWSQGLRSKFTPSEKKITPLCKTMPIIAEKEIHCKYCGATEDSFFFIKQPFPDNQMCSHVTPNNFSTCYYPGSKLDPL